MEKLRDLRRFLHFYISILAREEPSRGANPGNNLRSVAKRCASTIGPHLELKDLLALLLVNGIYRLPHQASCAQMRAVA